ncbi:hypothetical protein Tco_0027081 [Tanacetum coccineum]
MQTTHVAEEAATIPHDLPLPRVHSLRSDEGSMTLHELTVLCTTLSKKVESLESDLKQTKLTYGAAYTKLIMKVKKLENIIKSSKARRRVRLIFSEDEGNLEDPSKQGRKIAQLDEDEGITLVQIEVYTAELDISTTNVPVSTTGAEVSTASPEVKTAAETEPVQKKTKLQLEQERLGYEEDLRLQEQLDEEERQRIARIHEEANTFNAEEWDNIQAQIEADEELAQKLQAEERGKFSKVEKARLLVEMINERKRYHTLQQLKKLSFDEIKELFKTTMNRVKDFVPMKSDKLVPRISTRSSKRTTETELNHEGSKRQKTNEEQSAEEEKKLSEDELQKLMMIVPVEEVYVEALHVKVGNHTKAYQTFDDMLKKFNRDDLDKLWSLVKERFSSTDPTDVKERTLWDELKRLFELDIDDIMWKLQRYMHDPLTWRLYDTCGVHHVSTDRGHDIFMLVEKDYPLTRGILTLMLCNKLKVDQYSEMANELLKKIFILANIPRQ